jgi:hypothetical protein
MPKVTLRPTILVDLPHVIGEPLPYPIRAITALVDDRVIGMGGIAFPPNAPTIAFVQLAPPQSSPAGGAHRDGAAAEDVSEARRYPITFHRAGLMAMALIRASGVPLVVATADAGNDVAVRWLKRLGFTEAHHQPIKGKLLFVWTRQREGEPDTTARSLSTAKVRPTNAARLPLAIP